MLSSLNFFIGFVQPAIAINLLNVDDYDGFNDRHMAIICPKLYKNKFSEEEYFKEERINLKDVYKYVKDQHSEPKEYCLSEDAKLHFIDFFNEMEDRMEKVNIIIDF